MGWLEMTAQPLLQFGTVALDPASDCRMVRLETALAEQFFDIAERERVPQVPAHSAKNYLGLGLSPLEGRRSDCLFHDHFRLPAAIDQSCNTTGEASGLMLEDGGTVGEIAAAGSHRHAQEWRRALAKKFFSQGVDDLQKNGPSGALATNGASRYRCAYSAPQATCWLRASSFRRAARISSDAGAGTNWSTTGRGPRPDSSER